MMFINDEKNCHQKITVIYKNKIMIFSNKIFLLKLDKISKISEIT